MRFFGGAIMPRLITVRVEIPALDSLLAYLRETDSSQQKIDASAATVVGLTARLKQSTDRQKTAVANQQ
jgi:hypothetical protein